MEPLSNVSPRSKGKYLYEVRFPPGPMGLELEPIITSSERQIGCRVKDYYFGIDHDGVDPEYIKSVVSIGDIIIQIQGENMLSTKFVDVLDKLRSLRENFKIVTFKDISLSRKYQFIYIMIY
jgi:hypothetical protein